MTTTISRIYNSHAEARTVVRELEAAGIDHGDISIIVSNADSAYDEKLKTFPDRDLDGRDDRAEAAGGGATIGAAAGGTVGLLAGLGLMAIPGIGPVVAAGWLASTLAGAAAGGATGGIIGALTQAGVKDDEAEVYAETLRRGGALVSVKAEDKDAARAQQIMDRGSIPWSDRGAAYRKMGWSKYDPTAQPYTRDEVMRERSLYTTGR
jgi:hypothetical protein